MKRTSPGPSALSRLYKYRVQLNTTKLQYLLINVTIPRHGVTKFTWKVSSGSDNKAFSEIQELLIEIIFSSFTFTNCKCSHSHFTPPLESTAQLTNPKILMHPVYNNDVRKHCLLLSRPRGASIILYYI